MLVYGFIYWIDRVVASYHCSVVKVRVTKRAGFYSHRSGLSRVLADKSADVFVFRHRLVRLQPFVAAQGGHRLVSLTRDCYSVLIDLSGGRDLLELTSE